MNIAASLNQVVALEDDSCIGHARRTAQSVANGLGFDEQDAGRVALLATELASNVLKHAGRGELHLRSLPHADGALLELLAVDRAGGFDPHTCQVDGYSSSGTQGIGLGSIERSADVYDLYADSRGAVVLARVWPRGHASADVRVGISHHPLAGETACGDTFHLAFEGTCLSALLIDGLGHGPEAAEAARVGAEVFAATPFVDPQTLYADLHHVMGATRGGAVAVIGYDATADRLTFTGIGNIGGCLIAGDHVRGLPSHPGIVGSQFRKAQPFDYGGVNGSLLVLYSDGLQSRFNLRNYPGLVHRHPALIAAVLHRDFCRGRDDVTVLVIDLEAPHG